MSDYQPKKGDRVRVVIEGDVVSNHGEVFTVTAPDSAGFHFTFRSDWVGLNTECVSSPLPTTPGSVIKSGAGYWVRTPGGSWMSAATGSLYDDSWFAETNGLPGANVLFDAGANT